MNKLNRHIRNRKLKEIRRYLILDLNGWIDYYRDRVKKRPSYYSEDRGSSIKREIKGARTMLRMSEGQLISLWFMNRH